MVTLEDVAAVAGVSRATVSRVVNGDNNVKAVTREKVERAVAELRYTPNPAARALASSHSNTLGLVTTSYLGGFFGAIMDFVQTEAESHGKQLLVTQGSYSAENELLAIQRLFSLRCDGVILHVRYLSDQQLLKLAEEQSRFVLLDRLVPGLEDRCVIFDHISASQIATQQLIDAGHRRIACISGPAQRASSQLRLQGFLLAMQTASLQPLECLEGVYDLESGYQCADRLLRRKVLPSAIYCCNEEMAIGALLAINERHLRVPQDISLTCYDSGERAPFVRPALTTVHFPITEMAAYAARLLIDPLTQPIKFVPAVIQRDSIAKASH